MIALLATIASLLEISPEAPALILLLLGVAVVVILVIDDDDLPGPRLCRVSAR
ncbi:MAG TPA: hypothetical protein VIZ69_05300 [Thermoanaerobaculia bacterium]